MALPEAFLEEVRARTPLVELIARHVRLTRSGRQWKGCCPFHGEKTASFYVYEDHFHCFGCGAHGDAVSFVMQSQGLGFMEAVQQLAEAAGLAVPRSDPLSAETARVRQGLAEVLEAAERSFHRRLLLPEGKAALSYLMARGLTRDTIEAFRLGWSGEGRGSLLGELTRAGATPEALVAAGLARAGQGTDYSDFFFNRVMFPIRDARGRLVSFGGRLIQEGEPKYLNGPETELFAKRRVLYGIDRACRGARSGPPVVVEGYMDVLALHQAGFASAVAPLGTALTEEQLGVLWRRAAMPIVCFDGDRAGARAAERLIELALPSLAPERSLAFVTLPEGEDPDSLLRHRGAAALRAELVAAQPLSEALFGLARRRIGDSTPEQRAALRAYLGRAAERIGDRELANEYRRSLRERTFAPRRSVAARRPPPPPPSAAFARGELMRRLVALVLRQPAILPLAADELEALQLTPLLARLRAAIFAWWDGADLLDSAKLLAHLDAVGLAAGVKAVLEQKPLPTCDGGVTLAEAEAQWREGFGLLMNEPRLQEDLVAAERAFVEHHDVASEQRAIAVKQERDAVSRGEHPGDREP